MSSTRTTADILIVGSGAAGALAAIDAASAGADVLVLEALPDFGGTAASSGGGICIAGSDLQEQRSIGDSPDTALEDWLTFGGPEADADWAELYLRSSASQLFDWLTAMGVEWTGVNQQEGNRVPRWHAPKNGGAGMMRAVENHAMSLPIRWEFGTRVVDLVQTGGRVTGVVAEDAAGNRTEFQAGVVLLASGGFNNNPDMVRTYATTQARGHRVLLGGGRGATGDGHALLERLRRAVYPHGHHLDVSVRHTGPDGP